MPIHTDIDSSDAEIARLVRDAPAGEDVIFERKGRAIARLSAVGPRHRREVVFGRLEGQFTIPDDFDAPLQDDILDLFEGKP